MAGNVMLQRASLMGKALPRPLAPEGWREMDEHHEHFGTLSVMLQEARMVCSSLHLVGLFAESEWLARSVIKNSLTADRGLRSYQIGDLCAIDTQPIAELAGLELDPIALGFAALCHGGAL